MNFILMTFQRELRDEAAVAMANLTGVTTKDDLYKMMEDMGLQKSYSSKEDEEEALKALATRLDVPYRSDSFNDWIDGWMTDVQSPYDMEEDLKVLLSWFCTIFGFTSPCASLRFWSNSKVNLYFHQNRYMCTNKCIEIRG